MTEYLLSVWMDSDFDPATVSEQDTQRMYAQVDVFNAKLQAELGGFWVVKAADLDEALALAREGAKACEGKVEVRAFQGE